MVAAAEHVIELIRREVDDARTELVLRDTGSFSYGLLHAESLMSIHCRLIAQMVGLMVARIDE